MPRSIKKMPESRGRYPWEKWLDGKPRKFEQGVDFPCSAKGFYVSAKAARKVHKSKVRVMLRGDDVYIGK